MDTMLMIAGGFGVLDVILAAYLIRERCRRKASDAATAHCRKLLRFEYVKPGHGPRVAS